MNKCKQCGAVLRKTVIYKNKKEFCEEVILNDCEKGDNPLKIEKYECSCGNYFEVINDFDEEDIKIKCKTEGCKREAMQNGYCLICYDCLQDAKHDAEVERAEAYYIEV